jgi:hypothetical protein
LNNFLLKQRLPKPTIPIIYYQTQVKLNSLNELLSEFHSTNNTTITNASLKNKIKLFKSTSSTKEKDHSVTQTAVELFKSVEKKEKEKDQVVDHHTNSDLSTTVHEKIKEFEKALHDNHQENVESENNLKRVYETFKSQMEADDNKFSEDNLRKLKGEMENVMAYFREKLTAIESENTKIKEIFDGFLASNEEVLDETAIMKKLQMEIEERKKRVTLSRQLAILFSTHAGHGSVRPQTGPRTGSGSANNPDETQASNEADAETASFSHQQKVCILSIVGIVTAVLMAYPLAMIVMGEFFFFIIL